MGNKKKCCNCNVVDIDKEILSSIKLLLKEVSTLSLRDTEINKRIIDWQFKTSSGVWFLSGDLHSPKVIHSVLAEILKTESAQNEAYKLLGVDKVYSPSSTYHVSVIIEQLKLKHERVLIHDDMNERLIKIDELRKLLSPEWKKRQLIDDIMHEPDNE